MCHRMFMVPLTKNNFNKEYNTLLQITKNNNFPENLVKKIYHKHKDKHEISMITRLEKQRDKEINKTYYSLPYIGPTSYKIKKLLNKKDIHISLTSPKTLQDIFCSNKDKIAKTKQSGVYCLITPNDHKYIGRTFRKIETRFKKHITEVNKYKKKNKIYQMDIEEIKSNYARYILENDMDSDGIELSILFTNKDNYVLDTVEKYYIIANNNDHLINTMTFFPEIKIYNDNIKKLLTFLCHVTTSPVLHALLSEHITECSYYKS
ncbi:hypothetical protein ABEB36_015625 [Hypothenemus hampei]|uniref:GIY-YIG domain-containing protein n=1 Tax=Hypothenemus hampei TaxID=57062 RepID=A0ABD1DZ95_HYPHA